MVVIFKETCSALTSLACLPPISVPIRPRLSYACDLIFFHAQLGGCGQERLLSAITSHLFQHLICQRTRREKENERGGGRQKREQGSLRTHDARLTYCHHDNRHHFTGATLRMPVWAEVTELKVGISLLWVLRRSNPRLTPCQASCFFSIPSTVRLKGAPLLLSATCGGTAETCTSYVEKQVLPVWLSSNNSIEWKQCRKTEKDIHIQWDPFIICVTLKLARMYNSLGSEAMPVTEMIIQDIKLKCTTHFKTGS